MKKKRVANIFIQMMKLATVSVEFSFDGILCKQTDSGPMCFILGLMWANIFVGFHEKVC